MPNFTPTVVVSIIVFDQISKALAVKFLPTACNVGFAFGIGSRFLSDAIVVLLILAILFFLSRMILSKNRGRELFSYNILALSLILSGGLSNLIDRLIRGCVVDFIDLVIWPAFNLADAAITVGVVLLILNIIKRR